MALFLCSGASYSQSPTPTPAVQAMTTLADTLSPHSSYIVTGPRNFITEVKHRFVCGEIQGVQLVSTSNPSFQAVWSDDEALCLWLRFAGDNPKNVNSIVLVHMDGFQLDSQVDILKSIRDQIVDRSNLYPEGFTVSIKLDIPKTPLTFPIKYTASLEKGGRHFSLMGLIDQQGGLTELNMDFEEAKAALAKGDFPKAIEYLQKVVKEDPDNLSACDDLAAAYDKVGQFNKSLTTFQITLEKAIKKWGEDAPVLAQIYCNEAPCLEKLGKLKDSIAAYEKAIGLDPKLPYAHGNLAWTLVTCSDRSLRDGARALVLAKVELEIGSGPNQFDTLAAAYAANGQFDQAIESEQQAIDLLSDVKRRKSYADRLETYRQHQTQ